MKSTFALFATLLVSASAFVPSAKSSVESEYGYMYIFFRTEWDRACWIKRKSWSSCIKYLCLDINASWGCIIIWSDRRACLDHWTCILFHFDTWTMKEGRKVHASQRTYVMFMLISILQSRWREVQRHTRQTDGIFSCGHTIISSSAFW